MSSVWAGLDAIVDDRRRFGMIFVEAQVSKVTQARADQRDSEKCVRCREEKREGRQVSVRGGSLSTMLVNLAVLSTLTRMADGWVKWLPSFF